MAIRAVLALMLMLAAPVATAPPVLNEQSLGHWRDFIRPTPEETRWQSIPWKTKFWDGVTLAQKDDKPILAWVMNGHPLACT
jgi:hypothetical protein